MGFEQIQVIRLRHRKYKMPKHLDSMLNSTCPKCSSPFYQQYMKKHCLIIKFECDTYLSHNTQINHFNSKLTQSEFCLSLFNKED